MTEHEKPVRKPVNYDELFEGRFLKAGLLLGKPITLRIADVISERLPQDDGSTRKRGILVFEKTERQLVLNSTNGQCLRAMFGQSLAEWIGKRITLRPDRDRFGREVVDCIRVSGSPDLERAITCEIALPRKKPRTITLERTGAAPAAAPDPPTTREPGSDG